MEANLGMIMAAVREYAPEAIVFEEADGNVSIALNMKLNKDGLLESFPDEVSNLED
jgi:hypothetical protein